MRTPTAQRSAAPATAGKTRKEARREKKEAKKERIRHHFHNRTPPSAPNKSKPIIKQHPKPHPHQQPHQTKPEKHTKQHQVQRNTPTAKPLKPEGKKQATKAKRTVEETEDDKLIQLYEEKLGVSSGKDKYGKMAKKYGFDDDLFDFLDGISSKVYPGQPKEQQEEQEEEEMEEEGHEEEAEGEQDDEGEEGEGDQEFDDEYDKMFDNLDEMGEEMADEGEEEEQEEAQDGQEQEDEGEQQHQQVEHQNEEPEQMQPQQQSKKPSQSGAYRSPFQRDGEPVSAAHREVLRAMTGFFNKLSDGNILLTFREFVGTIERHPRSLTVPLFCELFTRFNLMVEKPLFHILATNVALAAGLHHAFGNRLMAPLLHALTSKFLQLRAQAGEGEAAEVAEFGYSKRAERLKNYATIVSLLYNYGSLTADFLQSLVARLAGGLDPLAIELLYILVQKCGLRVRQNDPSALKGIIATVREGIARYRSGHLEGEELQKIGFIEAELADIKFNKKVQAADQRMAFLQTFLAKNVHKEIEKEKEVLTLDFEQVANADTALTNWWEHEGTAAQGEQEEEGEGEGEAQEGEGAAERRRLLELARSFHMVTQTKRNIFLCLMDSKDYLQASQRILELRVRRLEEVASVLVEVCTLEPSFNAYYPLVAAKLAALTPKFRLSLQYAIWDHLKLIHTYELRRTANLAKFAARLTADPAANASLSLLRFFPDLSSIRPIDATFLGIFFNHFFRRVSREYLSRLVAKLREDNNRAVKEGIKEYLAEFEPDPKVQEKTRLCRRLLMVELDERKAERGDDD